MADPDRRFIGFKLPPPTPGVRAVRPKSAATLLIFRHDGPSPRVLMGRRNRGHDFMPGAWVFPGGRLERTDFHAPFATDLAPEAAAQMARYMPPGRARALALAAVRETFEEVGLLLARPATTRTAAGPWRPFVERGVLPDLAALAVTGRAITPPVRGRRFDTWFFMADARALTSLERGPDCGELEEIAWLDVRELDGLGLQPITHFMLDSALNRLEDRSRPAPFMRFRHRVRVVETL